MISNFRIKLLLTVVFIAGALVSLVTRDVNYGLDLKGGASIRYTLEQGFIDRGVPEDEWAQNVEETIEVIRKRIDNLGLKEIPIRSQGNAEIILELPGLGSSEVEAIESIIAQQGRLEFRLAAWEGPASNGLPEGKIAELNQALADFMKDLPADQRTRSLDVSQLTEGVTTGDAVYRFFPFAASYETSQRENYNPETDPINWRLLKLDPNYLVTGDDIAVVRKTLDQRSNAAVGFDMKPGSADAMGRLTGDHKNRGMTVLLDGQIHSIANIESQIRDSGLISGGAYGFKAEELDQLVVVLRSGSLPVKPTRLSSSDIGPTLGENSIDRGVSASTIGIGLVAAFILFYYMVAGFVAFLALSCNLILLGGALLFLQATLTLPGIAGIILTIGMAVDANILIFERIREERDKDKSLFQSVKTGFEKAFLTILDANLTTLFTGFILFKFGTGPIRGFAVTLMLGILTSMFSALVVSKILFSTAIEKGWIKELKMQRWVAKTKIAFSNYYKTAAAVSVAMVIGGLILFIAQGEKKYGLDFLGGYKATVNLKESKSQKDILALVQAKFPTAEVVTVGGSSGESQQFQIKVKRIGDSELEIVNSQADGNNENADDGATTKNGDEAAFYLAEIESSLGDFLVEDGIRDIVLTPDETANTTDFSGTITLVDQVEAGALKTALVGTLNDVEVKGAGAKTFSITGRFGTLVNEDVAKAQIARQVRNLSPVSDPFLEKAFIGARVGGELRDNAVKAIFLSFLVIIIYIRIRFNGYRFGIAAVVALAHDVIIALGAVAAARAFHIVDIEIDLALIAAFLTIIGYSLNDTIVVFDRIRENIPRMEKPLREVVNISVNQTLSRTLLTSITTLLVVCTIFALNYRQGNVLEEFSFTLIIGIIVGTYSSIFVASPVMVALAERYDKKKKAPAS